MNPDNYLPFELLPEGHKYISLGYIPDAEAHECWYLLTLRHKDGEVIDGFYGPSPNAVFMAALATISGRPAGGE